MRAPRVKLLSADKAYMVSEKFPAFSVTGSVTGMRKLYYGNEALLVRCGAYIYNVSSSSYIYHNEAK